MSADIPQIQLEVLQPDISSKIIKATATELKEWIKEGRLKPYHQVRVQNLSWMEARNVPAFKSLFEAETISEAESNPFVNQVFFNSTPSQSPKLDYSRASTFRDNPELIENRNQTKKEPKPAEPSVPFKILEEKKQARLKQKEAVSKEPKPDSKKKDDKKPKVVEETPALRRKTSSVTNVFIFLGGCALMFLLAFGGSYVWSYQLKSPPEVNEKSLPGVAVLADKLTSDKLELRVKAAKENNQTDLSQQFAQLEKQSENQRKTIIESHRTKLQEDDFYTTFYFSSAILLVLFLLMRILFGAKSRTDEALGSVKSLRKAETSAAELAIIDTKTSRQAAKATAEKTSDDTESDDQNTETAPKNPAANSEADEDAIDDEVVSENSASEQIKTPSNCVLHKGRVPSFVCQNCENYFCNECLKNAAGTEKCCPFCKLACQSLSADEAPTETVDTTAPVAKKREIKPVNLLELNKENTNFVVYEYEEERSRVAGVIQALVIALLFSAAISILWTYKIQPLLENKNQDAAQTVSPNGNAAQTAGQIPLNADPSTYNKEIDESLKNGPCIDPDTKKPFDCDEETRRALFDHTRKTQSVDKAKQDVFSTAKLISGSENESKEAEDSALAAAKTAQKQKERRQLLASFGISFVLIFGALLALVFFSKDKKEFLNQTDRPEKNQVEDEYEIDLDEDDDSDFEIDADQEKNPEDE